VTQIPERPNFHVNDRLGRTPVPVNHVTFFSKQVRQESEVTGRFMKKGGFCQIRHLFAITG